MARGFLALTRAELLNLITNRVAVDYLLGETRHLSDMTDYFVGKEAAHDPLIYQTWTFRDDYSGAELLIAITQIEAGSIGEEPFHTKGHFHQQPDGSEIVWGWQGCGILELGTRDGDIQQTALTPESVVWIAPGMAHRVVNPSADPLIFLSVSASAVGHDYSTVSQLGWSHIY